MPLITSLADAIKACLETIHPFAERAEPFRASPPVTPETLDGFPWAALRAQWIALAFAPSRYNREERQHDAFSLWATRLEMLIARVPRARARLCYERCLQALGRMDEGAGRAVAQWPSEEHDPSGQYGRARVRRTRGTARGEGARPMRRCSASEPRPKGRTTSPHCPAKVRRCCWSRPWNWSDGFARGHSPATGVAGQHLARLGCDPWAELERLKASLACEVPRQDPPVARRPGFLPGQPAGPSSGPRGPALHCCRRTSTPG